jgi:hypothetical protein
MARTDELTEARAIVRALERCQLRNDGDRRFLETWRGCLARSGEDAQISKWRLQQLRRVAASYGVGRADEPETAQIMDLLV